MGASISYFDEEKATVDSKPGKAAHQHNLPFIELAVRMPYRYGRYACFTRRDAGQPQPAPTKQGGNEYKIHGNFFLGIWKAIRHESSVDPLVRVEVYNFEGSCD
jgi:hypothetical protein